MKVGGRGTHSHMQTHAARFPGMEDAPSREKKTAFCRGCRGLGSQFDLERKKMSSLIFAKKMVGDEEKKIGKLK